MAAHFIELRASEASARVKSPQFGRGRGNGTRVEAGRDTSRKRPKVRRVGRNTACGAMDVATQVALLEDVMNKDQVKGVAEKAKGKVNEVAGKATGNVGREMKGDVQQGMGQARKDMGDAREDAKDAAKHPTKRAH